MSVWLRIYLVLCMASVGICVAGVLGAFGHDTGNITTSAICLPINLAWVGLAIWNIRAYNRRRSTTRGTR